VLSLTVAKVVAECEDVEDDEETEEDETVVCPTNDDLGGSYTYDVTVSFADSLDGDDDEPHWSLAGPWELVLMVT
jgi:hypothetical protein